MSAADSTWLTGQFVAAQQFGPQAHASPQPRPRPSSDCGCVTRPSHQPNVPGRGIVASYSARFWMLVVLVGLGAGLGGAALMELLKGVQHLAWSYHLGTFLEGVQGASATRRVIVLSIGGVVAGGGAMFLSGRGAADISEAIWLREGRLPLPASLARAVHSIVIVGLGASLGREAAPQQTGA